MKIPLEGRHLSSPILILLIDVGCESSGAVVVVHMA